MMTHRLPRCPELTAWLVVSALLLSGSSAAFAKEASKPRDFVTGYLAQKQAELQKSERNLRATERLQARDGLLAAIRAQSPLRKERIVGEGAQKDQVENALLQTLADYLASVGFQPNDVQTLRKAGVDVVQAGSNGLFGTATSIDEAAVAEAIVIARVDRRADDSAPNDGLASTLFVTIEKSYKGPYSAGQTLRIRQLSGGTTAVEGEIDNTAGQRYLLFVSPTYYQTRTGSAKAGSPNDSSGFVLNQMGPYLIQDGVLRATRFGQSGDGKTLAAFEQEIARGEGGASRSTRSAQPHNDNAPQNPKTPCRT
jgi:hypothetical protein